MRKRITLVIIFVVFFALSAHTYDQRRFPYEIEELRQQYTGYVPENWIDGELEIEYLDNNNKQEYIVLLVREENSQLPYDYAAQNKIIVLQWDNDTLSQIWQSEVFLGWVREITFEDVNNNETKNINIHVADKSSYYFLSFDWEGEKTNKILSSGVHSLRGQLLQIGDFDGDKDIEVFVQNPVESLQYSHKRDYYRFNETTLQYLKTMFIPQVNNQSKSATSLDSLNIQGYYVNAEIEEIYFITDNLRCIQTRIEDDISYLIVMKNEEDKMVLCYELPETYQNMMLLEYETDDINKDGIYDLIFADFTQGFLVPYYILSVCQSGYALISPVANNYESLVWFGYSSGSVEPEDIDGDGYKEIYADIEYKDKEAQLFWKWDSTTKKYRKYKIGYFDVETKTRIYIDVRD